MCGISMMVMSQTQFMRLRLLVCLPSLVASGCVPVYGGWGTPSVGDDILNNLRGNGELDDYERGEEYFEEHYRASC